MRNSIHFLFEAGMLKRIPRSGFQFLGTGGESVAEHSFRVAVIGYVLAQNEPKADIQKIILMSLFHDLHEARTGDHNYVNKRYVTVNEEDALNDLAGTLPYGEDIVSLTREFNSRETLEAKLCQDADQLDFILELKRQQDIGNRSAAEWLKYSVRRLITDVAKRMAEEVMATDSSDWWFEKNEGLWVNTPERISDHN